MAHAPPRRPGRRHPARRRAVTGINPWQTFVPGACIFLAVLSCNFVGEGVRDLTLRRQQLVGVGLRVRKNERRLLDRLVNLDAPGEGIDTRPESYPQDVGL